MAAESRKEQEAIQGSHPGPNEPCPPYSATYGAADAVPPAYKETVPEDAPPSYESIFGQVQSVRQESSGFVDFLKKLVVLILGTLGCTICVGMILAIPVSMITIGSLYLHDCPKEPYIPIYLIVGGVFGLLKNLSNIIQRIKNKQEDNDNENARTNPFDSVLGCFLFAWFIAGNVWIYRIYGDFDTDPGTNDYCHPTLYYYAFWLTTGIYILVGTVCCCIMCAGTFTGVTAKSRTDHA